MINNLIKITISFIALLLVQVFVMDNVILWGMIVPIIYPMFILMLPLDTPPAIVLLLAFIMGLSVGMFNNTAGLQAFTLVFLAFTRPAILRILAPQEGYEPDDAPTVSSLGFNWTAIYLLIGTFLHMLVYFIMEYMTFAHPGYLSLKIVGTTLISWIILMIIQYLFYFRQRKNTLS